MADLSEIQSSLSVKIAGANPSTGVEDNYMEVDTSGKIATKLNDGSGNPIASALDVSGARNILASMTHNIYVSNNNSSTSNLAASATFTGTSENNLNASAIQVCVKADQPLTVQLQQSNDNVHWDFVTSYYIQANHSDSRYIIAAGSYARVLITNNGTSTTTYLNLQTIFVPFSSVLPTTLTEEGNLKASIEEITPELDTLITADKTVFGAAVTSTKIKKLLGNFSVAIANNDVSSTVTGSGSVTNSNSMAVIASGTSTTATAKLFSNQNNNYQTGREAYIVFSAAFTAPTNANSEQRAGIYDANNGYFIGYHGLSFGVTNRNNGVDTFYTQSTFNEDLLNGNPNSKFVRNDVPEAVDFTKLNKYRIRYGFSTASTRFEIMNPDGQWVEFTEIRHSNSSTIPAILNPSLPATFEVTKTSSDATNLIISLPMFDAGIVDNPNIYGLEEINARKYVTTNVVSQTTSQSIYTNSTGRTLRVTSIIMSVSNSSLVATGQLNIRDGSVSGTILLPLTTPASTNQSNAGNNIQMSFPVPLRFSSGVYAQIASGTLTYSVTFIGYEAES